MSEHVPEGIRDSRGPLRRLFQPFVACHRLRAAMAVLMMLIAGLTELAKPWPLKLAVDLFLIPDHRHRLGPFGALATWPPPLALAVIAGSVVAIALLGGAAAYAQVLLLARLGQEVMQELRVRLFDHLQRLSLAFHRRRRSGELLVHLIGDLNVINDFLSSQSALIAGRGAFLLGMIVVMAWMDPWLTLASIALLPLLAGAIRRHVRTLREATRVQRRHEGRIAAVAGEGLQMIQVVQAFTAEERQAERLEREGTEYLRQGLRGARAEALIQRAVDVLAAAGAGAVLYLGVMRVRAGVLTAGDLIVFLSYVRSLQRPLRDLAQSAQRYAKASACARRVVHLLDTPPDVVDSPGAAPVARLRGEVTFDDVSFEYEPGRNALERVRFRVTPGESVAIVGETGAGKSTLFALLGRFYDPTSGVLRLDGVDARAFTIESVRAQIALVLQEAALFGATIRENLLYGNPHADEDTLWSALREAQAEQFVRSLPGGLDTIVAERGATLSGGQRQRIAVARALLRDAPMLLLDEPSTGLDAATDQALRTAFARLRRGRTCFVIAHQLDTAIEMDRILVLQRGRLVGDGRHGDLMRACAPYRQLWDAGSRGPVPVPE
jgi:ATP-binding cassette subfamily B protein